MELVVSLQSSYFTPRERAALPVGEQARLNIVVKSKIPSLCRKSKASVPVTLLMSYPGL
jgi:hypothetical protein